ncbi:MAG: MFS transporter [Gammaproteobacteria bacterium]|nr:MFS transporter [Gammaproteobacteria bacterium]
MLRPLEPAPVPWKTLLRDRRTWAIAGAKLMTDPVWWFLLFWLPDFMNRVYGLDLRSFGLPLATIYALATVGALTGGWIPGRLLQRGATLNFARKGTLLVCALAVVPIPLVLTFSNVWYAVLIVGLALAAHQGFSTNVFALATDVFPAGWSPRWWASVRSSATSVDWSCSSSPAGCWTPAAATGRCS